MNFTRCVSKTFQVKCMVMDDLMKVCPLVEGGDCRNSSNKQKRCILYWWFSTNVYLICGKGNRCKLPDCIISSIRKKYPNEVSVPYVGFKSIKRRVNNNHTWFLISYSHCSLLLLPFSN